MTLLQQIASANKTAEETLDDLQRELNAVRAKQIEVKKSELLVENELLRKQIELAKQQLIQLEVKNGKQQILVPGAANSSTVVTHNVVKPTNEKSVNVALTPAKQETIAPAKQIKEKKPKKEIIADATTEGPVDISRIDLRIGRIVEVQKHPDADSLYLEKIDLGEAQPRTVVSGLVKHVPIEEMNNRLVVVMCNLKPAKMRGVTSEGMVMCASTPEKVEILIPPANTIPGDLVYCEGYERNPDTQLNPKKKIFETVAPDLLTNNELVACYKGASLYVPEKGTIKSATLANVNVK